MKKKTNLTSINYKLITANKYNWDDGTVVPNPTNNAQRDKIPVVLNPTCILI